jgi:hypothetical protein
MTRTIRYGAAKGKKGAPRVTTTVAPLRISSPAPREDPKSGRGVGFPRLQPIGGTLEGLRSAPEKNPVAVEAETLGFEPSQGGSDVALVPQQAT